MSPFQMSLKYTQARDVMAVQIHVVHNNNNNDEDNNNNNHNNHNNDNTNNRTAFEKNVYASFINKLLTPPNPLF